VTILRCMHFDLIRHFLWEAMGDAVLLRARDNILLQLIIKCRKLMCV